MKRPDYDFNKPTSRIRSRGTMDTPTCLRCLGGVLNA